MQPLRSFTFFLHQSVLSQGIYHEVPQSDAFLFLVRALGIVPHQRDIFNLLGRGNRTNFPFHFIHWLSPPINNDAPRPGCQIHCSCGGVE